VWPRIVDADQYLHAVLIAVLLVSETTIEKLADHHISAEEVRQVSDGDRIVIRNPRPRRGLGAHGRPDARRASADRCAQSRPGRRRHVACTHCMASERSTD
jgi:hypothetical protein